MRIRFLHPAAPIDAEEAAMWQLRQVNATRAEVTSEDFVHDFYQGLVEGSFDAAVERLLSYRIFPPHRMRARVCTPDARVALGATIVQRVFLGTLSLETAVRVVELERSAEGASFAYATTSGHPEQGIASFAVRRQAGAVQFTAEAWSRAGHWLALLGRPLSRFVQKKLTLEAVRAFCADP